MLIGSNDLAYIFVHPVILEGSNRDHYPHDRRTPRQKRAETVAEEKRRDTEKVEQTEGLGEETHTYVHRRNEKRLHYFLTVDLGTMTMWGP